MIDDELVEKPLFLILSSILPPILNEWMGG
jgi:hypothetical protein